MLNFVNVSAGALFSVDSETLTLMWQTVLLGMGMVFAVLALLWIILAIFGVFFGGKRKEAKAEAKPEKPEKKEEAAVTEVPASTAVSAADDSELIAVITAAVAAYRESEEGIPASDGSFRVVSFKRVREKRAWNVR